MAALSLIPIRPSVHYYATARIVKASRPPYLCSETTRKNEINAQSQYVERCGDSFSTTNK